MNSKTIHKKGSKEKTKFCTMFSFVCAENFFSQKRKIQLKNLKNRVSKHRWPSG